MPRRFNSIDEARQRLSGDDRPLDDEDLRELIPWVRHLRVGGGLERIQAEMAAKGLKVLMDFSDASTKLTWAILAFTVIAAVATLVSVLK